MEVEAEQSWRTRLGRALSVCSEPRTLGRTCRIAAVVGLVLSSVNQGDVIVEGRATSATALKVALNFVVPFVVSNLGVLAGRG